MAEEDNEDKEEDNAEEAAAAVPLPWVQDSGLIRGELLVEVRRVVHN